MSEPRRFWRYLRGLGVPVMLWVLFVAVLADTLRSRMHGGEEYDEDALREWVQESRNFRDTLPEKVRDYLDAADPAKGQADQLPTLAQEICEQLRALGGPTQMYQGRATSANAKAAQARRR